MGPSACIQQATPDEQYSHVGISSLWRPVLIWLSDEQLDDFTPESAHQRDVIEGTGPLETSTDCGRQGRSSGLGKADGRWFPGWSGSFIRMILAKHQPSYFRWGMKCLNNLHGFFKSWIVGKKKLRIFGDKKDWEI